MTQGLELSRRAFCAGVVAGSVALGCKSGTITIEIEPAEIQQRLDAKFPVQRPLLLGTVTFKNPKVVLREGSDRLGVELAIDLQMPLLPPQTGTVSVSGVPEYRPDQKAFYLRGSSLDRLEVAGLPAAEAERLRGPAELVSRAVLDSFPVYELGQRNWKEASAEHLLESVSVKDGKLLAKLSLKPR